MDNLVWGGIAGHVATRDVLNLSLDFMGLNSAVSVANLRIAQNELSEMQIGGVRLQDFKSIGYFARGVSQGVTRTLNSDFFMTESDIAATCRNIAYRAATDDVFDLTACNGAVRIANVTSAWMNYPLLGGTATQWLTAPLGQDANFSVKFISPDEKSVIRTVNRFESDGIAADTVFTHSTKNGNVKVKTDFFGNTRCILLIHITEKRSSNTMCLRLARKLIA